MEGEVIVPSFTFMATAHALQWQEITPVFCDIQEDSHNLDPEQAERLITPRTSGIIGVHVWGKPCDLERLSRLARKHDLKLMYDASHAFGCSADGVSIGNFGLCEVFSFHATKFLNLFRRWRDRHERRRTRSQDSVDEELWVFGRRSGNVCGHQRQDERGLGCNGFDRPRES